MMKNKGLYIHIPFCSNICSYCDFSKVFYNEDNVNRYLLMLEKELDSYQIKDITSIYIGGGTPSSLNETQFDKLLSLVSSYYKEGMSFCVEANFENLTEEKIKLLNKYHVNRVSLGVQTFNDELLKLLNRKHTKDDMFGVINNLIKYNIEDINLDLIYALPNQTIEMVKEDLDIITSLPIKHISTYSLMVNPNTIFGVKKIKEQDEDKVREMYDLIYSYLKDKGFNRYEVSNFSKVGYESKHNLIYWRNEEYYGIGLGASGYLDDVRYDNTKSLTKYLDGVTRFNEEQLDEKDKEFYFIMLGLRLKEGIEVTNQKYIERLDSLIDKGLIEKINNRYKVTDNNLFILDYVLERVLF